ncbi:MULTISPECIES: type IV secretion system protein [unclassified Pseudonocardia]|uniref:type IV secretion system protein n=1 Tax=unclassified Pseudonocardia TaxID=2619320 RepID=UPI0001FFDA74|nr:type IV secretion system protein [Pseudonocardia sp. Ae707_Ps1]OLM09064.1 hypothetical protein Ae707Ps1_6011c [Pseudonocardia sp. Ae707_Ps1]
MTGLLTSWYLPAQDPAPPPGGGGDAGDGGGGGSLVGDFAGSIAESAFSSAMQAVWDSAIWLLKGGFEIADTVSRVEPGTITGNDDDNPDPIPLPDGTFPPVPPDGAETAVDLGSLWSTMIWLAALIALGLFFYQLASVALRGGRGMFRAVTGPVQFGIALAVTTGAVAALLTGADGLTTMFLSNLGEQGSFTAVLDNQTVADRFGENPNLGADVEDGVRSMILGIAALFGVIPAALGFALAMIFRAAAIMVLIATIPIASACLISDSTASMFWRAVRWILAAILMKPALALVVVIGVNIMSRTQGVAGLLAGTAVLLISLFCPMVLYRLLAFVDPGTGAGMAVRSAGGSRSSGEAGGDNGTSEMINNARATQKAYDVGSGGSGGGAAGGELGGSTAATGGASGGAGGAAGGSAGGGAAAGGGATGGGGAAGSAAAGAGVAGGAVAAAVVGGYLATKAAGQAAGGYGSSQMAQTGIGHPGPAPAAGASGAQISSSAGGAYSATSSRIAQISSSDNDGGGDGGGDDGPEPKPVDPSPPDPGPPGGGGGPGGPGGPQDPPEPPPANAGTDGASSTPVPEPERPTRDDNREDGRR